MALPKSRFPAGEAVDYYREVRKLINNVHINVIEAWEKRIVSLAKFRNDNMKLDDELDDISKILEELRNISLNEIFTTATAEKIAIKFATAVKTLVDTQVNRQIRKVKGVDLISRDFKLKGIVDAAVKENVSYIKSIPQQYHDKIETVILQGVRRGKPIKEISKEIENIYDVTKKRAKFIARDQAGSLCGDLTKAKHESLGLEYFIWSTSGDSKVRDTHRGLDGKKFKWSEGAVVNGKRIWPGTDFGCRCVAEAVEEELMKL